MAASGPADTGSQGTLAMMEGMINVRRPEDEETVLEKTQESTVPGNPEPFVEMQEVQDPELRRALDDARMFEEAFLAPAAKACTQQVAAAREAEGERVPIVGLESKASQLESAIGDGDVDIRKGLGQKFTSRLKANPLEEEKYKALRAPGKLWR